MAYVNARKRHECVVCGWWIRPGETYWQQLDPDGARAGATRVCERCQRIAAYLDGGADLAAVPRRRTNAMVKQEGPLRIERWSRVEYETQLTDERDFRKAAEASYDSKEK